MSDLLYCSYPDHAHLIIGEADLTLSVGAMERLRDMLDLAIVESRAYALIDDALQHVSV